jgi:hypothetical protein
MNPREDQNQEMEKAGAGALDILLLYLSAVPETLHTSILPTLELLNSFFFP